MAVALVCGGGGALGGALVHALLERGDRVVTADVHAQPSADANIRTEAVDLTKADEVEALWERLAADGDNPKWVVNAAGGFREGSVAESDPETVRFVEDLNLGTAWWSCRSAARHLPAGGAIVNIGSRAALTGGAGTAAYAVSKAGVVRLTEVLAAENAERGIRVNAVLPSVIDTPRKPGEPSRVGTRTRRAARADRRSRRLSALRRGGGRDRRDRAGLRSLAVIAPLELLYEPDGLPAFDLPPSVAALYPGTLGLAEPCLYANFVSTLDGVVAIPSIPNSNKLVADGSASDRYLLGLLRACADVLVIGSGTLRAAPNSLWTPEQGFPDAAGDFAELRRRLGRAPTIELVVLTGSGHLDPSHPALATGALVLTTDEGAARLGRKLPAAATAISLGPGPAVDVGAAIALLRKRGHAAILTEGGPQVLGSLLAGKLVDDLFLTLSPLLAGRIPADPRFALVEGVDLVPSGPPGGRLTGVRRDTDHLFLRYELR